MAEVNDLLHSSSVRHAHHLEGYKKLLARQAWELVNDSYRDAISRLAFMSDYGSAPGRQMRQVMNREQTENYIAWATELIRGGYAQFETWFTSEMRDFSEFEATWEVASIQAAANGRVLPTPSEVDPEDIPEPTPRGVAVATVVAVPTAQDLWTAVATRPMAGTTLEEAFLRLDTEAQARFERTMRQSWVENWTLQQTMQTLRGTSTTGYKDGITALSQRELTAYVRTGTNHTATTSRQVTYEQNDEVIKGWQFVATLDGRTSATCKALDGKTYDIGEGPKPPRHPNCRSVDIPLLKSWRELGFNLEEPEAETRSFFRPPSEMGIRAGASSSEVTAHLRRQGYSPEEIRQIKQRFSGQVPATTNYGDWLRRQDRQFQEETLGKAKARLFRDGNLSVDRFVDSMGRERTLAELKRLYPEAWKRAGLSEAA